MTLRERLFQQLYGEETNQRRKENSRMHICQMPHRHANYQSTYTNLEDGQLGDEDVFKDRVRTVVLPLGGPNRNLLVEEVHDLDLQRQEEGREVRPCGRAQVTSGGAAT